MLLRLNEELVGIAGWHVENLVSCTTDIFLKDHINLSKALSIIVEDIELSSNFLECEVSMIFPMEELSKRKDLWDHLNYEQMTLEMLTVTAWRDAAKELLSNQNVLYFKRLRIHRVLRPI